MTQLHFDTKMIPEDSLHNILFYRWGIGFGNIISPLKRQPYELIGNVIKNIVNQKESMNQKMQGMHVVTKNKKVEITGHFFKNSCWFVHS